MKKEIVAQPQTATSAPAGRWVDLETAASVRLTSEDPAHAIETALNESSVSGWKAATPGPQTIWFRFDAPRQITHILLRFDVPERRTQEFLLQYSTDGGASFHEIVRQQFNFSPGGASREEENYFPQLAAVTDLKLTVIPDISGGDARASLSLLRVAS